MDKRLKFALMSAVIVIAYWAISMVFDVYQIAAVGAIYELLWLPMLLALIVLPIWIVSMLLKRKRTN